MSPESPAPSSPEERRPRWMKKSLRDFDRTAQGVRSFLAARCDDADSLIHDARSRYADILLRVRWAEGRRAPMLNAFLDISAQEIALYRAIEARGGNAAEAWEICHRALRTRLALVPRWKRWLLHRLMFSRPVQGIVRRREASGNLVRAADFEIRSVGGDGRSFAFGADYSRCGNLELARAEGAEAFAPYLCMSDIALSDAFGWGLARTQTLADGCSHCDFRFRKGEATQITSRTPEVQATIDRIAREESAEAVSAR